LHCAIRGLIARPRARTGDMLVNPEAGTVTSLTPDENANQFEAYPTFQFGPPKWLGRHELKIVWM